MTSHAEVTFEDFDLHTLELAALGNVPFERIFKRDCLEIDFRIGGQPLTLYLAHFKSMGPARKGLPGRERDACPDGGGAGRAADIDDRFGKDYEQQELADLRRL